MTSNLFLNHTTISDPDTKRNLSNCGKDWKSSPEKFSKRMTYRNLNYKSDYLYDFLHVARLVSGSEIVVDDWKEKVAACGAEIESKSDCDFDTKSFFTEMRNRYLLDGTSFSPTNTLPIEHISVEYQRSGNATLRLSQEVVDFLNNILSS